MVAKEVAEGVIKLELGISIPLNAQNKLRDIKRSNGGPPSGHKGGGRFDNDGRNGGQILPRNDASGRPITYKEYDIPLKQKGLNRGEERVVRGSDKEIDSKRFT